MMILIYDDYHMMILISFPSHFDFLSFLLWPSSVASPVTHITLVTDVTPSPLSRQFAAQDSPEEPIKAQYSPLQSNTAQYSPVQPTGARYSPVQLTHRG